MSENKYNMITVLGHTAGGKTSFATNLALKLNGEIISADSRQVYRGMDIGTGKDIEDYTINGVEVPHHILDVADAGFKYNVFMYMSDFRKAFTDISSRNRMPVLCGGTGMYLDSVLKRYNLLDVPVNETLRKSLEEKSIEELADILLSMRAIHNSSDLTMRNRLIKAIEIEEYCKKNPNEKIDFPEIESLVLGIKFDRESRRRRITQRLKQRLDEGMIDEVKRLLESGVSQETLLYYGLEYKFLTLYIIGELSYKEMFEKLNTAIHQFAKRQMTWYRKMEKEGQKIHWLDGYAPMEEKLDRAIMLLNK